MFSYCTMKVIFFLLFGLKEIISTPAINLEDDITKLLDHWIDEIFAIDVERAVELIATIDDHTLKKYELSYTEPPWRNPLFQNISFHVEQGSQSEESEYPQLFWKFSEDQLRIFYREIHIRVWGTILKDNDDKITDFNTFLGIANFTFTAKIDNSSNRAGNLDISYDFSSSGYWHWLTDNVDIIYTNENLSDHDREETARRITAALPKLLHENINNNSKFANSLNQIFQSYTQPRVELISKHPDFLRNPQQYHYLIPTFPFLCFELKRIVINGLSNFDSFKVHKTSPFFTHTLLMKNLRGSMVLDYKSKEEKSLELEFQINSLFVMKKDENGCIKAQAKYYSVGPTVPGTKYLSTRQQELLMNALESAIASSIMPFTKIGRICDLDTSLEEIQISNKSDWNTIKKSYKEWIPFSETTKIFPRDKKVTN